MELAAAEARTAHDVAGFASAACLGSVADELLRVGARARAPRPLLRAALREQDARIQLNAHTHVPCGTVGVCNS